MRETARARLVDALKMVRGRVRPHGSIRRRILGATAVGACLALALALLAYTAVLNRILFDATANAAEAQARQVATTLPEMASAGTAFRGTSPAGSVLQLLDNKGRVLAYTDKAAAVPLTRAAPPQGSTTTQRSARVGDEGNDGYAVVALGLAPGTNHGASVLVVATPLRGETALVERATVALGGFALVVLAGVLWLINRAISSTLRRVENVRSSVAEINATRDAADVAIPDGNDEISRLATTMNQMLARLRSSDAAQRAFVSNASHELRSPLTTVRVLTETSPTGLDSEATSVVLAETLRMQRLVEDLLTLARADDDGLLGPIRDVDLDDVIHRETVRLRRSTTVSIITRAEPVRVAGDEQRLAQAVRNLTDNAARHARDHVRLTCSAQGGWAQIDIDNDGPIIAPSKRLAVFDRFVRLDAARVRDSGGSGLGLSIVQAIAQAHRGSVRADESPDGWCRFTLLIPTSPTPGRND